MIFNIKYKKTAIRIKILKNTLKLSLKNVSSGYRNNSYFSPKSTYHS